MNEVFWQKVLDNLKVQYSRYPEMQGQDIVKFVFQALLGVGHLLSGTEGITEYLIREMDTLQADPDEPLLELLSPDWCRLNLRRAMAEKIPPWVIAGLMMTSGPSVPFTRQDVYHFCSGLSGTGGTEMADLQGMKEILDDTWLPSHSSLYRTLYRPAYRVIPAAWIPYMDVIRGIAARAADSERLLVTIDGPCASGKTTLAQKLATVFRAVVAHTDDYVIPHAQKTAERLAIPGGNCDDERIADEILAPWKKGIPVRYHRYDCLNDRFLPEETFPDSRILILEGSYCNLPVIRQEADVRIYLDVTPETQAERLQKRESPESLKRFYDRWIPLEKAYFAAYGLPDAGCTVIREQA